MAINGKMMSVLATEAGTKVTKYLESQPMRKGYGRVLKVIEYPKNSRIAQLGIDSVAIRNAGKEGKHIMAYSGDKCIALGVTNPAWKAERSIIAQLKQYINSVKFLQSRGVNLK